jgi:hypothetical protein
MNNLQVVEIRTYTILFHRPVFHNLQPEQRFSGRFRLGLLRKRQPLLNETVVLLSATSKWILLGYIWYMKCPFFFILLFFCATIQAQDTLIWSNGNRMVVTIHSIDSLVRYSAPDDPFGEVYTMRYSDLAGIQHYDKHKGIDYYSKKASKNKKITTQPIDDVYDVELKSTSAPDSDAASRRMYTIGVAAGISDPVFKFGTTHIGKIDNSDNGQGANGYATSGGSVGICLNEVPLKKQWGLTCLLNYTYNKFDLHSYISQVNTVGLGQYQGLSAGAYQAITLMAGPTWRTEGELYWMEARMLFGALLCIAPAVSDSGHLNLYTGYHGSDPGMTINNSSTARAFAFDIGAGIHGYMSDHILLSLQIDFLSADPFFENTVLSPKWNSTTGTTDEVNTSYHYRIPIECLIAKVGVCFILKKRKRKH